MNKELAKTLTTALVQFIDENRPEGTMDCSSGECERLEKAFEIYNLDFVERFIEKKLSRLTEFEKGLINFYNRRNEILPDKDGIYNRHDCEELLHESAKTLLVLAREEFIKDGYVIEKKAFHDAVEKVSPEVMKEVSDNVDKENELTSKHLEDYTKGYKEGYNKGYEVATKLYNESVAYHFPIMSQRPLCYEPGGTCTNPHHDCINCPTKYSSGGTIITPNTQSGTSISTLHGNTSATDGKEHNPSFTD